jgi:hypothetical protein
MNDPKDSPTPTIVVSEDGRREVYREGGKLGSVARHFTDNKIVARSVYRWRGSARTDWFDTEQEAIDWLAQIDDKRTKARADRT